MSQKANFNRNHPELREGELYLTNIFEGMALQDIGWKTKRPGCQAYDIHGKRIDGTPVFVQISEMKSKNVPTVHLEPSPR